MSPLSPTSPPEPPAGMARLGKYELLEKLGAGGMAEVWKARGKGPAGFARILVVKRILPHLARDPKLLELFMREARVTARLAHSNIVQVYDLGEEAGDYFLSMEYVDGRDLIKTMRQLVARGRPNPGFAAFVVREICRALGYAHALTDDDGRPLGIIHRDVSPSNVMLGYNGDVKLCDFGIAKVLEADRTQSRTLRGKFGYLAPEQVEGAPLDHRVDLFAAGVLLHEALAGRRLFRGESDVATMALVRAARVERPSLANPDVPPALDAICLKALARDRDARYQSGAEMALALDEVVHALGFGPERLAALMREVFGEGAAPEAAEATRLSVTPRRRAPMIASAVALLALAGAGWALSRHYRERPPSMAAPVVAVALPTATAIALPTTAARATAGSLTSTVPAPAAASTTAGAPLTPGRAPVRRPARAVKKSRSHRPSTSPGRPGELANPFAKH